MRLKQATHPVKVQSKKHLKVLIKLLINNVTNSLVTTNQTLEFGDSFSYIFTADSFVDSKVGRTITRDRMKFLLSIQAEIRSN
jgi:hypothetical protein